MKDYQCITHRGESYSVLDVIRNLEEFVTAERLDKIKSVVSRRISSIIPVTEDLYDRGNVSAVMRSCEGLGFQEMQIIQSGQRFKEANRVTQGADKWLNISEFKETKACVQGLKSRGYKVCVTSLENAVAIDEIDFAVPTAVVFGNEKVGASAEMLSLADEVMKIPMPGFTQSFNISVAAAITLYHIKMKLVVGQSEEVSSEVSEFSSEKKWTYASYLLRSVGNAEKILQRKL